MHNEDGYRHFVKGTFPALFLLQVNEGLARFEVPDRENLDVLLRYCKEHGYQVEWTERVIDRPEFTEELEGFPGGRYVAHVIPDEILHAPGLTADGPEPTSSIH